MQRIVWMIILSYLGLIQVVGQNIYVSPDGHDGANGSYNNPVRSIKVAANLAVEQKADSVLIAGGIYFFGETLVLGTAHSGIVFAAEGPGETIFTAGIKIDNWEPYLGSIVKAPLPEGLERIRYLQDQNTPWLERSATEYFSTTELAGGEDNGCIECNNYTESTQSDMSNIRVPSNFIVPDPSKVGQYDLRANTLPWHLEVLPLLSYNASERRLYTQVPALYDLRKDAEEVSPKSWVLNSIEGIDQPGEWACIDQTIYYYPINGTQSIYAPGITEIIRIDNGVNDGNAAAGAVVQDITFRGITFTGGDFRAMESGDITAQHDWMVVDQPDALLTIRNAERIKVLDCRFEKSGGTGLRIDRYGKFHRIENNYFAYLGRGGINIAGRGPGYGDVSSENTIAYNYLEHIGMEKWASVAIMLDNSSKNYIHHNYITNTYFTGIAVVGPRQLMFAAHAEDAADFYVGREFHFWEMHPDIYDFMEDNGGILSGSQEAMRYVYNYGNRIVENALVDVCTGKDIFINGQIYISGSQRSVSEADIKTNYVERNYFYDSYNHSINDYVIYSDSDQDACDYIGNMIHGVANGDAQPEPLPIILAFNQWAETEQEGMGQIRLLANVSEEVTYCNEEDCDFLIGYDYIQAGGVLNGVGGSAEYLEVYRAMYLAICDENFPQVESLPGAEVMRSRLRELIIGYGGTVPDCSSLNSNCWADICNRRTFRVFEAFDKLCGNLQAIDSFTLMAPLKDGSSYAISAGEGIVLKPGFSSGIGSEITFSVRGCAQPLMESREKRPSILFENISAIDFWTYPNPINGDQGYLKWKSEEYCNELVSIYIRNLNGQMVQSKRIHFWGWEGEVSMDWNNEVSGTYIVELVGSNGWRLAKKWLRL